MILEYAVKMGGVLQAQFISYADAVRYAKDLSARQRNITTAVTIKRIASPCWHRCYVAGMLSASRGEN